MNRPFAAFDIDGTIIRWQLYHAVVEQLGKRGHIDPKKYQAIKDARMTWKRRAGDTSFNEYQHVLVAAHDNSLATITYSEYMEAIGTVMDEYKEQTYVYTRDLVRSLQQQGYLLFALSASQHEVVEQLAKFYGFDDWIGTLYPHTGEQFTGTKEVLSRHKKPESLKQLVEKHGATWEGSIAVGDSDGDIPMLDIVQHPIAFNPNKELFRHASKQGWKIVIERKNMYYELEKDHGPTYLLAQTNAR